jgi:bifunctional UDP-N-acetylglucosamine pyrophosphorylase / glucosamine-1-phosphate N-acetyltransferase
MKVSAVILAAGKSTRMHSATPKMLHPLAGRLLIHYAIGAVAGIGSEPPVIVVGFGADAVRQAVGDAARFAVQEQQLGTGHAVMSAAPLLQGQTDLVLVTSADMPLFRPETLRRLVEMQQANPGALSMLTVTGDDSHGFGRVLRTTEGDVAAVIEEAQATPAQMALREYNVGAYCFRESWLWSALKRIPLSPKGEYYLTDAVGLAVSDGLPVKALMMADPDEALGINTRVHLAEAEAILRKRTNTAWMMAGVTMVDPASTYIEPGVTIGQDTVIWPNTYLHGSTTIGEGCVLGPNTIIRDSQVGSKCTVLASQMEGAVLEEGVSMGPFGHLRKGAHLAAGVHMGNFGEVKNSYLGPGTKMGHFSYIGDATIGAEVNIGAGTITCNFDGQHKNHTDIGADVFLGSDTMLVAPVSLGEGARTGAGAVVTKDVPPYTLVVGVPAHILRKVEKPDGSPE